MFTVTVGAEERTDDRFVISFCSRKLNVTNHCGKFATSVAGILCLCFLYLFLKFLNALTVEGLLISLFVEFKREFELFVMFSFQPTTKPANGSRSTFLGAFGFQVVFECQ